MLHHLKRALWMSFLRLVTPLVVLSLLLVTPVSLHSQDPSNTLAVTPCEQNTVATFINLELLGTDSTQEILAHEEVHRNQAKWSIKHLGHCPIYSDHSLLLHDEVEAYCVSSELRAKRKDPNEINTTTILRLQNQFEDYSRDSLVAAWQRGCPKFAYPKPVVDRRELSGRGDSRLVSNVEYCASDISCGAWRPYARLGDTPAGDIYIAFAGEGAACLIDGWTAGQLKPGDRLVCSWRFPSARNQ